VGIYYLISAAAVCLQMCVIIILRCPKFGYISVGYLMLIFIVLCQLDSAGYGIWPV